MVCMQTIPVSCNKDCGGGCPLLAHVDDGKILRIGNNPAGTAYMKGCRKGFEAMKMDNHPDRLKRPLIRRSDAPRTFSSVEESRKQFREASWEEALDLAASRLEEIKSRYGCNSLLDLSSGGACRGVLHNNADLTSRFLTLWGGATRTESNYSSGAASFSLPYVLGTKHTGMDAGNLQHSKMIILWGYNAFDTRMGCEMSPRILEAKKRGVPIIVIDPRRTRTAESMGTWWIPIKPGSDMALMAAILFYLIRNDRQDHDFIDRYSRGFPQLKAYVMGGIDGIPKNLEWASQLCGIPVETIEKLADMYSRIKGVALLPGLSLQRAIGGEEAARMPVALQLATGNIGVPGGSSGGMIWGRMPRPGCRSFPVPSHKDPSFPIYLWPDVILNRQYEGKKFKIKAAYITGGNLLAQGSDLQKNIRAFGELELIIGHDFFLTPTMALCDIVFPVASFLERNDIVKPAGNFLLYSSKAVEPPEGVLTDFGIFTELAGRLGFRKAYTKNRSESDWLNYCLDESDIPDIEEFKKSGIYIGPEQDRNGLEDFIKEPAANPLNTPSGRLEISPEDYEKTGFPAYPHIRSSFPENPDFPLSLITPHPLQGIHSQFGNVPGFRMEEDKGLWMNPLDASARKMEDRDIVRVCSFQGEIELPLRITDGIMNGCVSLNEGLWPVLMRKNKATVDTGGSVNILTPTEPTMPSRSTRTHTVFVEVKKTGE